MKRWSSRCSLASGVLLFFVFSTSPVLAQSFDIKSLQFNGQGSISSGTALAFGPDGRLYATEVDGDVWVYTIERDDGTGDYDVVAGQNTKLVQTIPNHNDDGTPGGPNNRQVTGIAVGGTLGAIEVYVSSSDKRVGAGGGGGDANLDTNSGVITRLTCPGGFVNNACVDWTAVDMVRGLPRSEENHATNGMELVDIGGEKFLLVSSGGFTNAGSPSNNFTFTTEYTLSAAVLAIDLTALEALPELTDASSGRTYVYDIPTLDDPTRPNVNGIDDLDDVGYDGVDPGDPFGGNDGLNQAKLVVGGPVKMFSPGYRNTYDLVVTESGGVYVTDNGANGGWGGYPEFEGTPNVTNNYRPGEPGSSGPDTAGNSGASSPDPQVNNDDHLNKVTSDLQSYTFGSVYGGHPTPVRANVNAGLYTRAEENDTGEVHTGPIVNGVCDDGNPGDGGFCEVFRTQIYDPDGSTPGSTTDPLSALPADWPPVPAALINTDNADFRQPHNSASDLNPDGDEDITVTAWPNNTNGICEYSASNFGNAMKGNLIAGKSGGSLHRVILDANGDLDTLEANKFSTSGGNPLGVECVGDGGLFPGTIWVATFDSRIVILEPQDFVECILPGEPGYDPQGDNDFDGYTNQDEIDNNTEICNGGSIPPDFDSDSLSDLNDIDDDNDGVADAVDALQLGVVHPLPVLNEFSFIAPVTDANGDLTGYLGLGVTGVMNNGAPNPNYLDWLDVVDAGPGENDIYGGAIGAVTIQQTGGTAFESSNDQEKAFQYGFLAGPGTGTFTVEGRVQGLGDPDQLYSYGDAYVGAGTPGHGISLGTGFQDDYVELIITAAGLTMRHESAGATVYSNSVPIAPGSRPTQDVLLFLEANPATGAITGSYQFDVNPDADPLQGERPVGTSGATLVGSVAAQGDLLTALGDDQIELVTGLIGSSADLAAEYGATYDYLYVTAAAPFIAAPLQDIERLVDAAQETIDLALFFDDNNGVAGLTYAITSNTNSSIGATIAGSILTLTYPASAQSADITIRATDGDALFVEQVFTVDVLDEPVPIIRVNAGGVQVTATDGGPVWQGNTGTGPQAGVDFSNNTGNISTHNLTVAGRDTSIPAYVSDAEYVGLFANERWDPTGAPEMQFSFDVTPNENYEVRLYMANGFSGTSAAGQRQFAVNIEGVQVFSNKDLSGQYGHQVGVMEAYATSVGADGVLNVEFIHQIENPLINAIEILAAGGTLPPVPIVVDPIGAQASVEGENVSFQVAATGGDAALVYSASGLPTGLTIDPASGLISGTVGVGASVASPYAVSVTVDDNDGDAGDTQTVSFSWTVTEQSVPGTLVYRVNTGGPLLTDTPGDWAEDQATTTANGTAMTGTPSPYVNAAPPGQDVTFGAALPGAFSNATGYPDDLFLTERYNAQPVPNNMQWDFPVANGDYTVNLLFAEVWTGAQVAGVRVFDVEVEGNLVLDDFDQTATFGWATAGVQSIPVTVSDGSLDIDFIAGVQNPNIKAIEIIAAGAPTSASMVLEVNIPGRGGDGNEAVELTVDFYQFGAATPTYQFVVTADANGIAQVTGMDPETYEVAVKASNTLQQVFNITLGPGDNGTLATPIAVDDLLVGDVTNDNQINILDLSAIAAFFDQAAGASPNADVTGDGSINILDLSAVAGSFDTSGEQPSGL